MPTDYSKGKIYAIRSYQTDDIYIGSTCQSLSKRMGDHRGAYKEWFNDRCKYKKSAFEILKYPDAYIELIQEIPCISKMELCRYEGQYIRTMKCVNKNIPCRTKKEYRKDNYLKEKQQKKEWYEKNKEEVLKKQKEYYEKNKEKVKCICGGSITHKHKARHEKTKKHRQYIFNLHNELNHL